MKFLKWLLTILAAVCGMVALGGAYAAVWITDHDLNGRVASTAFISLWVAVLAGFAAYFIWSEE